jgi:CPA1 family monovalent cation:H+ antiporter
MAIEKILIMNLYHTFTIIIVFTALFSYINYRFIRLPNTIGIMIMSLLASLIMIGINSLNPNLLVNGSEMIRGIDFHEVLMDGMLSFMLFAGAIHINAAELKKEKATILTFSTAGVMISTLIIGTLLFWVCSLFNLNIGYIYCLLFGALISPTDPIAVMGILKEANIPKAMEIRIVGESLFNDGVAVVVFISILQVINAGVENMQPGEILFLFLREAGGGLILGIVLGYIGFYSLRSIDYYKVEIMITLAIVMGGYYLAERLHVSGPLAMVVAGIITGNMARQYGMSEITRDYLDKFWEIIDEILNAVLFFLIGIEMIIIEFKMQHIWIGLIGIVIVLIARFLSVLVPFLFLRKNNVFQKHSLTLLTWGGLRGGISVALALSLPKSEFSDFFLTITYIIVLFSIIVQGLTIGRVVKKLL